MGTSTEHRAGFVGRSAELSRIGELVEIARGGRGGALLMTGVAGVGKTRLLAEAAASARKRGMNIGSAACLSLTTMLPFDPVLEVLRSLGAPLRLPAEGSPRELFGEVLSRLEEIAATGPLLVCVDDLQWSDAASLDLVQYCLERFGDLPIGWLLAARRGPETRLLTRGLTQASLVKQIELRPLSRAQTHEFADAIVGPGRVSDDLAGVLFERTGGNPFLCEELLRALAASAIGPDAEVSRAAAELVPVGVREATMDRVGRLAPGLGSALTWASVLSIPFTVDELGAVGGPDAGSALGPLAEVGFLASDARGGWSFAHAILRDAVYGELSGHERVRRHGVVADALRAGGLERRAPQLAAAQRWRPAAEAYLQLAASALDRGQGKDACRLYDEAVELADRADDQRLARQARAGHVLGLLRAGQGDAARREADRVCAELRDHGDDKARLAFLGAYAQALADDAFDLVAARAILGEARQLIEDAEGPSLAEALAVRGMVYWQTGDPASALLDAQRAVDLARTLNAPALLVRALNALGGAVGMTRSASEGVAILAEAVDLAHAAELPADETRLRANLSFFADKAGDIASTEAHVRMGLAVEGAPAAVAARLQGNLGIARWDLGDLDGAVAHMLSAQRIALRAGPQAEAVVAFGLALVRVYRGELTEARRLLEHHRALDGGIAEHRAANAWGYLLEAEGSTSEALAHFEHGAAVTDNPSVIHGLAGVTRTAVAIDDLLRARDATARLARMIDRWPFGRWLHEASCGWLAVGEGFTAQAVTRFESAADVCPEAHPAVRLRLQAARLARNGDALLAVIADFERMGAVRDADRARAVARQLGMRPGRRYAHTGVLSPREQQVAEFIAAGQTNDEIAAALFLSPRTVERHVGSILAKLGHRSRIQIAAQAAAGRLPGTTTGSDELATR